jgi:hypothetical protein
MASPQAVRIFRFLDDMDAFVATEAYRDIADTLGLSEWTPVVWIGRLFALDNDYGEHWFDNWELREQKRTFRGLFCGRSHAIQGRSRRSLSLARVLQTVLDRGVENAGVELRSDLRRGSALQRTSAGSCSKKPALIVTTISLPIWKSELIG